ncbi:hypothetical protein CSC2_34890 [Clostridium zeae]|uniref:Uncharacterized protein n=1 Tax=Clostridium zeae TaxID=2759022 RepID=A0ABQ1EDR3_9CLOT|nr:hypothetical protein [Clostridium zeae]GFZ32963.1 hypothetical protein CSC2_34890 [Clostridium zeae]
MRCFCENEGLDLKLEADFCPDPLWCCKCGCNLEIDEFSISSHLKSEIRQWLYNYEQLSNYEARSEELFKFYKEHNSQGLQLAEKIQSELGEQYTICYYPS